MFVRSAPYGPDIATRGDITEGAVLGAFARLGLTVLLPFRHDLPYDLVVATPDDRFIRVQCKGGRLRKGSVVFNCTSTDHGRGRQDYRGRADVFAVFCAEVDRVFVLPVEDAAGYVTALRVEPSRNGQQRGIRDAEAHTVERWARSLLAIAA